MDDCDAVFLSVDVDVVDPGAAPGTGTPEPGGLSSRQLLDAVRRIAMERARRRDGRRRGLPALRPRRDHGLPRQPRRARGARRHRLAPATAKRGETASPTRATRCLRSLVAPSRRGSRAPSIRSCSGAGRRSARRSRPPTWWGDEGDLVGAAGRGSTRRSAPVPQPLRRKSTIESSRAAPSRRGRARRSAPRCAGRGRWRAGRPFVGRRAVASRARTRTAAPAPDARGGWRSPRGSTRSSRRSLSCSTSR